MKRALYRLFPIALATILLFIGTSTAFGDSIPPVAGGGGAITPTNIAPRSLTLSWTKATDDTSAPAALRYEVRRSFLNNIGTVISAEINGQVVTPYTTDIGSVNLTGLIPERSYFFNVIVIDEANNKSIYTAVNVATPVEGDVVAPVVSITSPADGTSVVGSVTIAANATDDIGVVDVQFFVDGNPLDAALTMAPYSVVWDTTQMPDGIHSLTARARDAANATTSAAVAVTVVNLGTPYALPVNGGQSLQVTGSSAPTPQVSHAELAHGPGHTTPTGVAIISTTSNSVLLSEAGVPASAPIVSGLAYVDIGSGVNTGIAFANEGTQDATVSFYFTDGAGVNFGSGSFILAAKKQLASFLDAPPFNGPNNFRGTFSFVSTSPIGAIATRGLTNERAEFLFSTSPISTGGSDGVPFLPLFADGGGWTTQVILTNFSSVAQIGTVQFFGQGLGITPAAPLTLTVNGITNSTFNYSLAPRSMTRLVTSAPSAGTTVGSVVVTPTVTNIFTHSNPTAFTILSYKKAGVTVSESSVLAVATGTSFRAYAESFNATSTSGALLSGVAVANTAATSNVVTLELTNLSGAAVGATQTITLPPRGQVSKYVNELFAGLPANFRGILRVSAASPIGVTEIRGHYNSRGDYLMTTMPPLNESASASTDPAIFPHVVSGGGYATQIVIFGGEGTASAGRLSFTTKDGAAISNSAEVSP